MKSKNRKSTLIETLESRQLMTAVTGNITTATNWTKQNSPYVISGGVYVRDNATLTIEAGVTITGGGLHLGDDGTGGKLVATNDTFSSTLNVGQQSVVTLTGNTFSQNVELDFFAGSNGSSVTTNKFNGSLNVAPQFVSSISNNTFPTHSTLYVLGSNITSSVTLPAVTNVTNYSIDNGGLYVRGGGTLTLASGSSVSNYGIHVSDDGSGGKLIAPNVSFGTTLNVGQAGVVSLTGDTFSQYVELDFFAGSNGSTVTGNHFNSSLHVAPQYVTSLGSDVFPSNTTLYLLGSNITSSVSLPTLSNVTGYSLDNGGLYVRGGGTLTIASGSSLSNYGVHVSDDGSGGKLTAPNVNFGDTLNVGQAGVVSLTGDTFSQNVELDFFAGSNGSTVTGDHFNSSLHVAPQYVTSLASDVFPGNTTLYLLGSNITSTVSLPILTNVTGYSLDNGGLYVRGGGTLNIATGASLSNYGVHVSDDGTGGKLNASGVSFGDTLNVGQAGVVTLTGDTFSQYVELDFFAGSNGSVVTGNHFNSALHAAPQYLTALSTDVFPANTTVYILGSTINSAVTLPVLTNVTAYSLDNGGLYVRGGGTLTIANGNILSNYGVHVSDDNSGGKLIALAVEFTDQVFLGASATGTLSYDIFTQTNGLYVDGKENLTINQNNFAATVVTAQNTGGPINLSGNWWGTTTTATIEANRVYDKTDNTNLPTITLGSLLTADPTLPDLTPTALTVTSGTLLAGQAISVGYSVKNNAGDGSAPPGAAPTSLVTFAIQNAAGTTSKTLGVVDVAALNGGATASGTLTLNLPAATDAFWGSTGLPGSYKIVETVNAGNSFVEQFVNNNTKTSGTFTVTKTGSIAGTLFNDANANAIKDSGEAALPYWVVFLDVSGTGVLTSTDPVAVTNASGQYTFTGLAAGTYKVREILQQGWRATTPGGALVSATVAAGATVTASPFGDTNLVQITGSVFTDTNSNGKKDTGETALAGQKVFIDLNGTGVYASNDPTATTDASGNFTFNVAGGTYKVGIVVAAGHKVTTPTSGFYSLTTVAGQVVTGELFGVK